MQAKVPYLIFIGVSIIIPFGHCHSRVYNDLLPRAFTSLARHTSALHCLFLQWVKTSCELRFTALDALCMGYEGDAWLI
ncbi:hypothetical protein BJ138DRAFT_1148175 [Hygrophoropsis aurantiaca]|uniref:Uncharacterized protein n=1 Tax=Hygrophoropsis aurantiaca TaxID=72124 RepID=A0ACB8AJ37_9AGAM|nr:hypothetical protein BJ138DRAFT_1148175 [Hygrophoropsis aurantiaca]